MNRDPVCLSCGDRLWLLDVCVNCWMEDHVGSCATCGAMKPPQKPTSEWPDPAERLK